MLLYHDGILSAIDRLLWGTCYDSVLRSCADNHLLCARNDHGLLCSGTDNDLLRADNHILRRANRIHEQLPRDFYLRLSDYVLRVLSTLAVLGQIRIKSSALTVFRTNFVCQKTCATTVVY